MVLEIMFSFYTITALLGILLLYLAKCVISKSSNLPPGPIGYPVVGSMHLFVKDPMYIALRKLRKQYGDIYSFRIGPKLAVAINGYDNLREAFVKNANVFSERPDLYTFQHTFNGKGVIASSGQLWKDTRTFALSTLRGFGFGKRSLESQIMEEIKALLQIVADTKGQPFDAKQTFQNCTFNVICNIVYGSRFQHDDTTFLSLIEQFDEAGRLNVLAGPLSFFPLLRNIPGDLFGKEKQDEIFRLAFSFIDECIENHRETLDENSPRDYIDVFLIEQKKKDKTVMLDDETLRANIFFLFVAGTQTTANTLNWAILLLLHNNSVQDRLRREVETVVGSSRLPSLEQRDNMPYFDAFLTETRRIANILPSGIPHGLKQDVIFRGYTLPKGTVVFSALDSVLNDPLLFEDPEKFDPNRFLDKDGNVCHTDKVISFSLGRRICMGESLARMELFLFLTSLIQRYRILPENANSLPSMETNNIFLRDVQIFRCKFVKIE